MQIQYIYIYICGCYTIQIQYKFVARHLKNVALLTQNSLRAAVDPFRVGRAQLILREQSEFADFEVLSGQETSTFEKNRASSRLTVQHVKPWSRSRFFYILWIELRLCIQQAMIPKWVGKILPTKTTRCFHETSSLFQNFRIHSLRSTCHVTCPLPVEYHPPREQAVSTNHFQFPKFSYT